MKTYPDFIKHNTMKTCVGLEVQIHVFLTSVLDGGEWLASHPDRFAPAKQPRYPLDRTLYGPQSRSGRSQKELEADHSPPSSTEDKNAWSYTSTPQYAFMAWCSVKAQGQVYLYLTLPLLGILPSSSSL
jgi:hypothetical protein